MRIYIPARLRVICLVCLFAMFVTARPNAIFDITNVVVESGGVITRIDTDGSAGGLLGQDDLINVKLTGFTDANPADLVVVDGENPPDPHSDVLEDFSIDTGPANPSSVSVVFEKEVVNRPGADIILVDVGGNNDAFTLVINAVTNAISANVAHYVGFAGRAFDIWGSSESGFTTVSNLNDATFTANSLTSSSFRNFYLVDLSDFGLSGAANLTILASTYDPVAVLGIESPLSRVDAVTYDNALDGTRMFENRDYIVSSITVDDVVYTHLEGAVITNAESDVFVFGTYTDNSGGEYSDFSGSVSGLNMAFGLGNMSAGGIWRFSGPMDEYIGFAFFELTGQEPLLLAAVDAAGDPVGTLALEADYYGVEYDAGRAPAGGWYRPTYGAQFGEAFGPVGVYFTRDAFQGSGDWSMVKGFRLDGDTGIDPFVMLGVLPSLPQGTVILVH